MAADVLAFDIETVPDVALGRELYGVDDLSDAEVAEVMYHKRRQDSGSEFLRPHVQRVVAIAVALRSGERFRVWSLGDPNSGEAELIQRFFDGVERYRPVLVSWNGGGFDLPVLHYRALRHGIAAPCYWDTGGGIQEFRWNNYLNRFHERHTDLMDVLAGFQPRACAPLDEIAVMLGLPGKMGMDGSKVWGAFQEGRIEAIRAYCETDALNTYLVFSRFQQIRGLLDDAAWRAEQSRVRTFLEEAGGDHWEEFLSRWAGPEEAGGARDA